MPAVSKKQQQFFGIVRAIQKGEQAPTTPEPAKAAADMKKSDVKKFASTKHKGLPNKVVQKEELDKNDKAFQAVAKKYAGQMMGGQQQKKVRGQKPDESNTPFKRAAERMKKIKMDNKALADKAKKAGYKSTQDYVNVQAVSKGGLGT